MKKLLYIAVNSKPEEISASKTVAREFINRFIRENPEYILEELDIYKEYIPRLSYRYFDERNCVIGSEGYNELSIGEKKDVDRINELARQFIEADVYVVASPVWSLLFPAPLKEYLDCIIQDGKTIKISDKIDGLLDNKDRYMVYIQSSGASMNVFTKWKINQGGSYIKDISKILGISDFKELYVHGTGTTIAEKEEAIERAINEIDGIIREIEIKNENGL